jgi:hypothetical protein
VARKHVYFYAMLLAASVFANAMKDSFSSDSTDSETYDVTALQVQLVEASEIASQ